MGDNAKKFRQHWVEELRAGALEVAEHAEDIVGNLSGNISMSVTITLGGGSGGIGWPEITIERKILSRPVYTVMVPGPDKGGEAE